MSIKKIKVTKNIVVRPPINIGAVKRPEKTIAVKKTIKKIGENKIAIKPISRKLEKSQRELNRIRIQQTVENTKNGKRKIVLAKNKIRKDANYDKISELRNSGSDRILVMIACGPSVLECDFSPLNGVNNIDIMVINKPLDQVWPPKYWAFCDQSQYKRNKDKFNSYGGILINSSAVLARRQNQVIITAKATTGVSRNIHEGYVIGRSSVYANIQVALWMNYDKVFIFGVDMCAIKGKLHHYGKNPDVPEEKRLERFNGEAKNYDIMASKLPENICQKLFFCSGYNPFPFVDKFNKWDHNGAVDRILKFSKSIL